MAITPSNLELHNPVEITTLDFSDIGDVPVDEKETEIQFDPEKEKPEKEEEVTLPVINEEAVENVDDNPSVNLVEVINILADSGLNEVYEGFDPNEEPTSETVAKLIEHNVNLKVQEELDTFYQELSDSAKRIIEFDLKTNSSEEEVRSFLKVLLEESTIKSLDIANEYDQEKILRMWYSDKMKFSQVEVDEKITELKDAALLEKEARRIKPKLDEEAESIAKKKEEEARNIQMIEEKVSSSYNKKVVDLLSKGELGGIKLNKEDISQIYTFLTGDKFEITTYTGKKVSMPPLEAIIFHNKYSEKGSLENLALATLLLTNPKKFEDYYLKKATTETTRQFIRDHKYSSSLKIGGESSQPKEEKTTKQKPSQEISWRLKL